MANYIAAEFKPLYVPFDYSFPPCKEYAPSIPFSPLQAITVEEAQETTMQLKITHVNRDKGMRYESYSLPLEATALKGLFRRLSREFGRCTSKVYVGEGTPIGWVFEKKQPYTDKGYFIQETWVTINAIT